jgi:hypothetical protein
MKRVMALMFLSCTFLIVASCSSSGGLESFPGLQARVADYYAAEQRGNWEVTYEFRHPEFRKAVAKDRYVSQMERDNRDWRLVKYEIESVREKGGKVHLKMKFTEIPPKDFQKDRLPAGTALKELEAEDESVWILIGGTWYAYAPATRARLSLNSPIAVH